LSRFFIALSQHWHDYLFGSPLLSLFVAPDCRQQGIGSKLVELLEASLRQSGAGQLHLSYQTSSLTQMALEPLLLRQGWQTPEPTFLLAQTTIERIAAAPWLSRYRLPKEFTVFDWSELTSAEAARLQQQSFPESLSPFTRDPRLESLNSLGLRHQGKVVGWMLTHRVAADKIRYSTMYVAPPYQKMGRGVSLIGLAIQRQIQQGIPYFTFSVAAENAEMQRFVERHLKPYLTGLATAKRVQKILQG
jgi:ribosomal protein S18 acetylase RimI-like enzyme